jgi:hypothetical protein
MIEQFFQDWFGIISAAILLVAFLNRSIASLETRLAECENKIREIFRLYNDMIKRELDKKDK